MNNLKPHNPLALKFKGGHPVNRVSRRPSIFFQSSMGLLRLGPNARVVNGGR